MNLMVKLQAIETRIAALEAAVRELAAKLGQSTYDIECQQLETDLGVVFPADVYVTPPSSPPKPTAVEKFNPGALPKRGRKRGN